MIEVLQGWLGRHDRCWAGILAGAVAGLFAGAGAGIGIAAALPFDDDNKGFIVSLSLGVAGAFLGLLGGAAGGFAATCKETEADVTTSTSKQ